MKNCTVPESREGDAIRKNRGFESDGNIWWHAAGNQEKCLRDAFRDGDCDCTGWAGVEACAAGVACGESMSADGERSFLGESAALDGDRHSHQSGCRAVEEYLKM